MMQDGNVIMVGDAVELCMMPGDQAPQVARLQALWSQAAAGCSERMLAQCCLFYRPSVRLPTFACHYTRPTVFGHAALLKHTC